jgi:hypothetical protein
MVFALERKQVRKKVTHQKPGRMIKSLRIQDIKELRDLAVCDELDLDLLGDRKTALFVIISDTDDTFDFVVFIIYT